jgi:DNA topoisomerase-1
MRHTAWSRVKKRKHRVTALGSTQCRPTYYTLVIAEKPKAASRIALSLTDGSRPYICRHRSGVPYWVVRYNNETYIIAPAAGHLFGLHTELRSFPVFDYVWKPLWEIDEESKYTRPYYETLKDLSRRARAFINACDYDIEGSVIGYLIIKFLGDEKRAYRVKFSALTRRDIRLAFSRLQRVDYEMVEAGLARHELDWIWGINISRALMDAVRSVTGRHVVLSAGRVQSPTLAEAVDRDLARKLFVPLPSYALVVTLEKDGWKSTSTLSTFENKESALKAARVIGRRGYAIVVRKVYERKHINPPYPFNLGDLQSEAARLFGYSPYYTQRIAEELYLEGLISYPRTNSQKIPATIDVRPILDSLSRVEPYSALVKYILSRTPNPRPRNGPKDDPAHPAIHPTGELPQGPMPKPKQRIYDLIVRRFLASMATPAVLNYEKVFFELPGGYILAVTGERIIDRGWMEVYRPYVRVEEKKLPLFVKGEKVPFKLSVRTRFSEPPSPYTKIELVKWMERQGLGTEATRARIVELLFKRGYLIEKGKYVYATDLGVSLVRILRKYFPEIVSVSLTRYFEQRLVDIMSGRTRREEVLAEAKIVLRKMLEEYKRTAMKKAGIDIAQSLGVLEPAEKCLICGRQVFADGLCSYHYDALRRLREGFQEWLKRGEKVSYVEYLKKIDKLRVTGQLIRDVIRYELKNSLTEEYRE